MSAAAAASSSSAHAASSSSSSSSRINVKLKRKRTAEHDGPTLVRFPHGPPAQLASSDAMEDIEFTLHAQVEERKKFQRILTASTPSVVYAASNYGSTQSYTRNPNQYAIGIFDATKNKVKIIECPHVYRMEQHVRALDRLDASAPSEVVDSFATKQRVLADTFGSKKTQKRLASRAANEVKVQESTSQVLTHAIGTIQPNEMEEESSLLDTIHATVLPRYDDTAEKVHNIYPVTSLMPAEFQEALVGVIKSWRSVLKKGESGIKKNLASEEPLTTSKFLENRMLSFKIDHPNRDEIIGLFIYFHLLLSFRNGGKNKRKLVQEWSSELYSDKIKDQFLSDFTTTLTQADGMPRLVYDGSCEQKVLCYLAVTSLILTNFTLTPKEIEPMTLDLKMMGSDLQKYYAEAGCTVTKARYHLSAPLKLPKLRKKLERK